MTHVNTPQVEAEEPGYYENTIQGLMDTVEGTEGNKLTSAQLYLEGAMQAKGVLRKLDGNEGVLSDLGEGFNKVFKAITGSIRELFGTVFKTTTPQKATAAITKMEDSKKVIQEKIDHPPAPVPEDKKKDDLEDFKKAVEVLITANEKMIETFSSFKTEVADFPKDNSSKAIQSFDLHDVPYESLKEFTGRLKNAANISDPKEAKAITDEAIKELEEIQGASKHFSEALTEINQQIKGVEEAVDAAAKGVDETKGVQPSHLTIDHYAKKGNVKKAKDGLAELKAMATVASKVVKVFDAEISALLRLQSVTAKACGA